MHAKQDTGDLAAFFVEVMRFPCFANFLENNVSWMRLLSSFAHAWKPNCLRFDFLETVEHKSTACRNALSFTVVFDLTVTGFHGFLCKKSGKIHFGGATPHTDFGPAPNPSTVNGANSQSAGSFESGPGSRIQSLESRAWLVWHRHVLSRPLLLLPLPLLLELLPLQLLLL